MAENLKEPEATGSNHSAVSSVESIIGRYHSRFCTGFFRARSRCGNSLQGKPPANAGGSDIFCRGFALSLREPVASKATR